MESQLKNNNTFSESEYQSLVELSKVINLSSEVDFSWDSLLSRKYISKIRHSQRLYNLAIKEKTIESYRELVKDLLPSYKNEMQQYLTRQNSLNDSLNTAKNQKENIQQYLAKKNLS